MAFGGKIVGDFREASGILRGPERKFGGPEGNLGVLRRFWVGLGFPDLIFRFLIEFLGFLREFWRSLI